MGWQSEQKAVLCVHVGRYKRRGKSSAVRDV